MATVAGQMIAGRYRLESILGSGATGTVWRAIQTELDRAVALKVMQPSYADSEQARTRFRREARVAATLEHPHTVRVLDFGEAESGLYLVMELVVGKSLRQRLDAGPVREAEAVVIVSRIAEALDAAHEQQLVHRDIKPENVILANEVDGGPFAKVVDFGLAFIAHADSTGGLGRLTEVGLVIGTPAYMSPEQVRGGELGPASDIYSLGCLFYELFAQRPPFVGSVAELMTRHAYSPPVPLRDLDLEIAPSAGLDELVRSMLHKVPSKRPTPFELATELARFGAPPPRARPLGERAQRAIPPRDPDPTTTPRESPIRVGLLGALDPELELVFAASEIVVEPFTVDAIGSSPIVWAPGADIATLQTLVAAGKRVVTDVATEDNERLVELIRAGVAEPIVHPIDPMDLTRRLRRAARRRRQ